MGDDGESVYSPVEPFSEPGVGDGSLAGVIRDSNGAVTLSESIGGAPAVCDRGPRVSFDQVDRFCRALRDWE